MTIANCQGQSQAVARLQQARRSGRIAHGYIFFGPGGVGKNLLAVEWAKLLLCRRPTLRTLESAGINGQQQYLQSPIEDCCDQCEDCRLADAGTHPDLHRIYKELIRYLPGGKDKQPINLPIDVIREFVIKAAGVQPQRGRARVFIIDQAELMNTEAQNALLKTLEEPPPQTFIILISSHRDRLLPTIRSRCQSVRFNPLPDMLVYDRLISAGLSEGQAGYWTRFSQGRLGDALRFGQADIYSLKCELIEQLARLDYPSALETAAWVVEQAKEFGTKTQPENSDESTASVARQGYALTLRILSQAFASALRAAVDQTGTGEAHEGTGVAHGQKKADISAQESQISASAGWDQPVALSKIAARFGAEGSAHAIKATQQAAGMIAANVNPALIFESLLLQYLNYASRPAASGAA